MKASELLLAVLQRHGIRLDEATLQQELAAVKQEQRARRRQRSLAEYVVPASTTSVLIEVTAEQLNQLASVTPGLVPLRVSFKGTRPRRNQNQ
ncbi:MAG: hypothetical protein ABIK73_06960 [candidate division WOR-3 bacterium]